MINLFYHKNEWQMSTRSSIGCNNRWGTKSFKELFNDLIDFKIEDLNKDFTYSFVIQSVHNPCVMHFERDNLILVNVMKDNKYINVYEHINFWCCN